MLSRCHHCDRALVRRHRAVHWLHNREMWTGDNWINRSQKHVRISKNKNAQMEPFWEIESDRRECFIIIIFFLRQINYWFRLFSQQIESNVPIKLKFAVLISVNRSECALSPEFGKQSKQPKKNHRKRNHITCEMYAMIAYSTDRRFPRSIESSRDQSIVRRANH